MLEHVEGLHKLHLVHHDLKLDNVFIKLEHKDQKGRSIVGDLGLAGYMQPLVYSREDVEHCRPLVEEGILAPEVLRGITDVKMDIFKLGHLVKQWSETFKIDSFFESLVAKMRDPEYETR